MLAEKIARSYGERLPKDRNIIRASDLVGSSDDEVKDVAPSLPDAESPAPDEMLESGSEEIAIPAPEPETGEEEATPVLTRPVAQGAQLDTTSDTGTETWQVRFGLCLQLQSCKEIVRSLTKKNISATIKEGSAAILTQRIMVGPWPTETQAMAVSKQLAKSGTSTSPLTVEGKKYLVSDPIKNASQMATVQNAVEALKLDYTVARKREPRQVYKVFATTTYSNRAEAMTESVRLRKLNIDNVIEQKK